MNTNNVFATLISQHPTFEALRDHLVSLGVQMNTKDGDPLVIFRYNREKADLQNPTVRAFRSVIWDSITNRPVFVAPMKSEPSSAAAPPVYDAMWAVEDFVDGVMVNVFMDPRKGTWRLATRSRLDADNKFYEHTFASLFMSTWTTVFPGGVGLSQLNPDLGYSFVLQHPANRIVVPVPMPMVTCVEITSINPHGQVMVMPAMPPFPSPRRYAVTNGEQFAQLLVHLDAHEGVLSQGIVLRELGTGRRWKARTNAYTTTKRLRGNHSRLEYVWFDNMQKGTLDAYLALYPEERVSAQAALKHWSHLLTEIYNWYVHVFKVRDTPKENIPAHYKGVLYDLHGEYIKRLAPAKLSLTWNEFQTVMAKQDLKRIVFLVTFKTGASPPPSVKRAGGSKKPKHQPKAAVPAAQEEMVPV
jgi:hypothetical protein